MRALRAPQQPRAALRCGAALQRAMAHSPQSCAAGAAAWPLLDARYYDAFLLDMDGVLWHGATPIPGALETVARLQSSGKRVFFVTNNSTRSRATVAARLSAAGVAATVDAVLTSGAAAADYVAARLPAGQRRTFVIGEPGLLEELSLAGCACTCAPQGEVSMSEAAFAALFEGEPEFDAVVVGADAGFTYAKLARASAAVQRGALLVCCNPDAGDKAGKGVMPGTGPLLAALECATGVRAVVVGKPAPVLIAQLLTRHGLDPQRTVMVGDRLDTDCAFGNAGGVAACLVLTGVATAEQAAALPPGDARRPTHMLPSLADLLWT